MNIRKTIEKKPGVYAIVCPKKMKFYIGSSLNVNYRLKSHLSMLKRGKHNIKEMQADFDKYKLHCFAIQYFEDATSYKDDFLRLAEKCYMLCVMDNGLDLYNKSNLYSKYSKDSLSHLKEVISFDLLRYINAYNNFEKAFYRSQRSKLSYYKQMKTKGTL